MPFENISAQRQRIAIIGGGISGMGAALKLASGNHVTLFESEKRLGGHARTQLAGKNGDQPVDTGFIVFNEATYPNLISLFDSLDVPVIKSNMSFGVSVNGGKTEYALSNLNAIKHVLFHPPLLRMFRDLLRFNKSALDAAEGSDMTLRELIEALGLSAEFRDLYILPFSGAIWSSSLDRMLDFPADALLRFFKNHNLLATFGQHQWYTVQGGSIEYVNRLKSRLHDLRVDMRLGAEVRAVRRAPYGVYIRSQGGTWELFDQVVFACHSDQALALMFDPSVAEMSLLGAIKYQPNRAVLHADPNVMPKRKSCWASWVYVSDETVSQDPVGVSYWMNSLQSIPKSDPIFQSLNPSREIRQELIYEETSFAHPVFDQKALDAQVKFGQIQGQRNTWFCGAYLRNGFHEDGLHSGFEVARALLQQQILEVAA